MMEQWLNLLEETKTHFEEGARSVKAFTNDKVYIITKANTADSYWVTLEEPGFPKTKSNSLEDYFQEVFGIEALY
jgi:hypothetical protein